MRDCALEMQVQLDLWEAFKPVAPNRQIDMPSIPSSRPTASFSPEDAIPPGRSVCFGSPHTTIRLFSPNRVRNIRRSTCSAGRQSFSAS